MESLKRLAAAAILCAFCVHAQAQEKILQILHVNDIHSFWESSDHHRFGGIARVKALMDELEKEGDAKGWITIRLDAGDFCDGNIDYLTQNGKMSFLLEKALGFDAIALGNHDYLTGLDDLVTRAQDSATRLPLVAANFIDPQDTAVEPGYVIHRGGLKISISGASVVSDAYNWAAWPAYFKPPLDSIESWFKDHPGDVNIALTHIGIEEDRKLAMRSHDIDVVVGGHTHIALPQPEYYFNSENRLVPVVQAGSHGVYVGQMILHVYAPRVTSIDSYELHRVDRNIPEDSHIAAMVASGRAQLATQLHANLNEVVATATQDFYTHVEPAPLIGNLFADAMREAAHTDIAIDSGQLYNGVIDSGPLTTGDVFNMAPHVYSWATGGWHIYKCDTRPFTLAAVLSVLASSSASLGVSGMDLKLGAFHLVTSMKVGGKPMDLDRSYTLALSEGFADALFTRRGLEKLLCSNLKDTGILVRDALLKKARALKVISPQTLGAPRIHRLKIQPLPGSTDSF